MQRSRIFFGVLLVSICIFTAYFFKGYITTAFLALIVASMLRPVFVYFSEKKGFGKKVATTLTAIVLSLFIIIPLIIFINIVFYQLLAITHDYASLRIPENITIDTVIGLINSISAQIPYFDVVVSYETLVAIAGEVINPVAGTLRTQLFALSNITIGIVIDVIFFGIFVVVFIPNVQKITEYIKSLSPLEDSINDLYINRITSMSTAMIRGSFVIAFVQAIATGMILWLAGVPYVFFFALITFFLCLVPIGSWVVLIPAGILFIALGSFWKGALLIASYFLIIGNIDNILRPMLVSKDATIHPILMLVSVFAGFSVFGFWGFIYGPLVAIVFVTTLQVYKEKFS